jgi:hypothetical protein
MFHARETKCPEGSMSARLMMIALDGADSALLENLSDVGQLPNLAALRKKGVTRHLSTPLGVTDDSLWASFQYGVDEASHGRIFYHTHGPDTARISHHHEEEPDPFWRRLGKRHVRLAILDIPKCTAPRTVNGIHLADWLVHGKLFMQPRSFPATLVEDVIALFGPAPPSECDYFREPSNDTQVITILNNLRISTAKKRAAALHYLAAEPWDLFIVAFKEGHCAGHGLWNFADRGHPEFDEKRSERLGWPVQTIFKDLDAAIGDLVAAAGQEAQIVVFSTTNMQANGSIAHLLPQVVLRINAVLTGRPATWLDLALERLDDCRPARPARWLARALQRLHRVGSTPAPVEMMPSSDNCGALRLAGGDFFDASERARLLKEADQLLLEMTDAETGLPVVTSITHPSSEQRGECAALLPDILIHYRSGLVPSMIHSARLGRIKRKSRRRRPGNHAMGGLAVVAGTAAIPAGASLTTFEDFAPFIEKVLGVPD